MKRLTTTKEQVRVQVLNGVLEGRWTVGENGTKLQIMSGLEKNIGGKHQQRIVNGDIHIGNLDKADQLFPSDSLLTCVAITGFFLTNFHCDTISRAVN